MYRLLGLIGVLYCLSDKVGSIQPGSGGNEEWQRILGNSPAHAAELYVTPGRFVQHPARIEMDDPMPAADLAIGQLPIDQTTQFVLR